MFKFENFKKALIFYYCFQNIFIKNSIKIEIKKNKKIKANNH